MPVGHIAPVLTIVPAQDGILVSIAPAECMDAGNDLFHRRQFVRVQFFAVELPHGSFLPDVHMDIEIVDTRARRAMDAVVVLLSRHLVSIGHDCTRFEDQRRMLLDVFAHCLPALEQVFAEGFDQRGQFFLAAFPGRFAAFVFPEGRPILVAALSEVSSDMADASILLIAPRVVQLHAANVTCTYIEILFHITNAQKEGTVLFHDASRIQSVTRRITQSDALMEPFSAARITSRVVPSEKCFNADIFIDYSVCKALFSVDSMI